MLRHFPPQGSRCVWHAAGQVHACVAATLCPVRMLKFVAVQQHTILLMSQQPHGILLHQELRDVICKCTLLQQESRPGRSARQATRPVVCGQAAAALVCDAGVQTAC